jgi:hypothetical protein
MAILETNEEPPRYLVCTPKRGVLHGEPLVVDDCDVTDFEYFEG